MILRTVLMVAYSFPPWGGMGALRVARFAKYLPLEGWNPIILTVNNNSSDPRDPSLIHGLPSGIQVVHTKTLDILGLWASWRKRLAASRKPTVEPMTSKTNSLLGNPGGKWGLFRTYLRDLVLFPDPQLGWVPFALIRGLQILSKQCVSAVYVTAPPWSALLVGVALKIITGVPLVSDLRDPLFDYAFRPTWGRPQRAIMKVLEGLVIGKSDRIVVAWEGMRQSLTLRYGPQCYEKIVTITNSFDPDDFANASFPTAQNSRFSITFVGSLYRNLIPRPFLEGFSLFVQRANLSPRDVIVTFAGNIGLEAKRQIHDAGLQDFVEVLDFIPHADSVSLIRRSDLLLIILPDVPLSHPIIPGKVFEYLAAKRPILAVAPYGAVCDMVSQTGRGVYTSPSDVTGISRALQDAHEAWEVGTQDGSFPGHFDLEEYSSVFTTKRLASTLETLS